MNGSNTMVDNPLDIAAAAAVQAAESSATFIITRPGTSRSRVFGAEPTLRGAIAVAVAAGSDRRWVSLDHGIHRVSVIDLPAVVREVAERQTSWRLQIGVVRSGNTAAAVVLWFGPADDEFARDQQAALLELLTEAADAT
ncbi:MAG TPA: hypothetical protein VMM60_00925 [Ilumatobacter sp.]|nr:hypothetical protein [Ilumatobacter sp.]